MGWVGHGWVALEPVVGMVAERICHYSGIQLVCWGREGIGHRPYLTRRAAPNPARVVLDKGTLDAMDSDEACLVLYCTALHCTALHCTLL